MKYRIIHLIAIKRFDVEKKLFLRKWKFISGYDSADEAIQHIERFSKKPFKVMQPYRA
jgi:hypothetical protein